MKSQVAFCLFLGVFSHAASAQVPEQADPPVDPPATATVVISEIKDRDTMPYGDAFKKMEEFGRLKENDKIYLRFFVELKKSSAKKIGDVTIMLDGGDLHQRVAIEDDGTLGLPLSQAAADAKAEIISNQGGGTLKIYYGPGIKVPEATTFKYRDIMDGVNQSSGMMKKFWNFLYPSFKGASLRYAEVHDQYLVIQKKDGDEKIAIDPDRKSIVLEMDSVLYRDNPTVVVSERPRKILPFNVAPPKS